MRLSYISIEQTGESLAVKAFISPPKVRELDEPGWGSLLCKIWTSKVRIEVLREVGSVVQSRGNY